MRGMKRRIRPMAFSIPPFARARGGAEEGLDQEALQGKVTGELGAVVEGDGPPQRPWQGFEQAHKVACDTGGELAFETDADQEAGGALVDGQDRLTVFGEHHQVGLPMAVGLAIGGLDRALIQGNTALDEACGASAAPATTAALALAARQIAPPGEVRGSSDLGIDEAIDALVRDHLAPPFAREPAGDLLGDQPRLRPAKTVPRRPASCSRREPFQRRARVCCSA